MKAENKMHSTKGVVMYLQDHESCFLWVSGYNVYAMYDSNLQEIDVATSGEKGVVKLVTAARRQWKLGNFYQNTFLAI